MSECSPHHNCTRKYAFMLVHTHIIQAQTQSHGDRDRHRERDRETEPDTININQQIIIIIIIIITINIYYYQSYDGPNARSVLVTCEDAHPQFLQLHMLATTCSEAAISLQHVVCNMHHAASDVSCALRALCCARTSEAQRPQHPAILWRPRRSE